MHMFWDIVVILGIVAVIVCVPLQFMAMNRIAFGRSIFITAAFIVMGLIVGMLPNIAATVVSVALLLMGFWLLVFMGIKSFQRIWMMKRRNRSSHSSRSM